MAPVENNLLYFSKKGLFPGKGETLKSFFSRATVLNRNDFYVQEMRSFKEEFEKKLGAWPSWIPIKIGSQGLAFFEKGATFISDSDTQTPVEIVLKKFREKNIFDKEVLFHEMVHAIRYRLNSKRFEEPIAYFFSRSRFRKWLGATFRKTWHSWAFLTVSVLPSIVVLACDPISTLSMALLFLPAFSVFTLAALLSIRDTLILKKCLKNLASSFPKASLEAILVRLDDEQVSFISKAPCSQLKEYLLAQAQNSACFKQLLLHFSL
ncbi:hypothetical protein COB21_05825 [Candidatus Aerophobetes bacterium]|uniref:Uncharacterized protein n=1 Tax=Aerophobetes bacterium TaxID=2030807 RepID=A0A2A4WYG9_UNCAE|nr:MAG: hypothetical protein COB21_05825 [Candidatus Aerophobetes bacterium]